MLHLESMCGDVCNVFNANLLAVTLQWLVARTVVTRPGRQVRPRPLLTDEDLRLERWRGLLKVTQHIKVVV